LQALRKAEGCLLPEDLTASIAQQLLKRTGHSKGGRRLGTTLLKQLNYDEMAIPMKYRMRFGSANSCQSLIASGEATVLDALQQACRSEPELFLEILSSNLHDFDWQDAKVPGHGTSYSPVCCTHHAVQIVGREECNP
jgi:hypothetical protein